MEKHSPARPESRGHLTGGAITRAANPIACATLAVFLMAALLPGGAWALTGREIMDKVDARDDGDKQVSDLSMVLIDKRGNERLRQIRSFTKDFGEDTRTLMFFLAPADVKDTGFLTYDYAESGKDDDQWLFLPALRKTKRIAGSDQSGSFMGSDFNYSDMTDPDLDDYTYELMKEEEIDGVKVWQIQATPKDKEIAEETGYSKGVLFVRQDNYVVVRAVQWVHKSRDRKFMQVKKLEQIDGIWVATELQMVTKEGNRVAHTTRISISNVKFNQDLDDSLFTVRTLEKGL